MADTSFGERVWIVQGVQQDLRTDGRCRSDYRPLEVEAGIIAQADGSARLHLGATDVLVGVKVCVHVWGVTCTTRNVVGAVCSTLSPAACSRQTNNTPNHQPVGGAGVARQQRTRPGAGAGQRGVLVVRVTRVQGATAAVRQAQLPQPDPSYPHCPASSQHTGSQ
jgi:hypothetical protein